MKLIFATGNKGKLREASEILGEGCTLVTPAQMGLTEDIPETGETLKANSEQKVDYLHEHLGCDCFADDTGLEVDALGGAPGVHTARYSGVDKDFNANMDKLLAELGKAGAVHPEQRRARFHSVVTLLLGGRKYFFEGTLEGWIAFEKAGCGGFGYDPVFIADEYPDRTLAEISEEAKNEISHRGKALRAMAAFIHSHPDIEKSLG